MQTSTHSRNVKPRQTVYVTSKERKLDRAALRVGLSALVVILPLILFSATLILFQVRQLNLPNVFIFDHDVGLINREDTAVLIDEIWNQNRDIELTAPSDPKVQYQLKPHDLGLWIDPQATADIAFGVGRSSTPLEDLTFAFSEQSRTIMPVVYFDETQARQTLELIADDLAVSPEEAELVFLEGTWIALPGKAGRVVNIDKTLEDLLEDPFSILLAGSIQMEIETVKPAVDDLSPVLNQIEALVAQDYHLSAYDPIADQSFEWSVPIEQKTAWVAVDKNKSQISLAFKPEDVERLLDEWETDLGEGRVFDPSLKGRTVIERWQAGEIPSITIHHTPTTYRVSQGESLWSISLKLGMPMWYIIDANPGLTVDNLTAEMELTIPSKNVLLSLPVVPNKRIVIDISEQKMIIYENGNVRNTHIVSTGVSDSPTMAGVFQVQTHELNAYASNWDLYMPHFLGIYESWPGFMNGIHGLPLLSSGNRLWASSLGSPASYGCIILDLAAAEDLYYWADPGVVVEIRK